VSVRRLFGKTRGPRGPRIFFATDIHGSDRCFRKFLNAAKMYGIDYLVLGGDITAKTLVPIVRRPDGSYDCQFAEDEHRGLGETEVEELRRRIRGFGAYTVTVDEDGLAALEDEAQQARVFEEVVIKSIEDWVALAEERLRGTGVRCFMAPGNDDFLSIDRALTGSDVVEFAENRVLQLDDDHEMLTTGYSNQTPWNTERELTEEQLRARIDGMARDVRDMANLVAVLHPPPHHSGIDDAPLLDDNLSMRLTAEGVTMGPVGSTAVREFIEAEQPLLGLHGHVHEGRGAVSIGRTLCINPGSEYTTGTLNGALIELGDGQILSHQLISG
jgi:Icc-related predicted phosphoesterase